MKILAIEGSTRLISSTLTHVEALLKHQASVAESRILRLRDYEIPLFMDVRPEANWPSHQALALLFREMRDADLIIIASPLYWYSVSGLMKNFIDHWLAFMKSPELSQPEFLEGKRIFPLIVGSEGAERSDAEPAFKMLQLSGEYLNAKVMAGFLGEGDREGRATAESLRRIALENLTDTSQNV